MDIASMMLAGIRPRSEMSWTFFLDHERMAWGLRLRPLAVGHGQWREVAAPRLHGHR